MTSWNRKVIHRVWGAAVFVVILLLLSSVGVWMLRSDSQPSAAVATREISLGDFESHVGEIRVVVSTKTDKRIRSRLAQIHAKLADEIATASREELQTPTATALKSRIDKAIRRADKDIHVQDIHITYYLPLTAHSIADWSVHRSWPPSSD